MDSMETPASASQPSEPTPPSTSNVPSSLPAAASSTETVPSSSPSANPNPNQTQNTQPQPQPQQPQQQPQQPQQQPQQPPPPPQAQQHPNYQHSHTRPPGVHLNRLRPQPPYQNFTHVSSLTSPTTSAPSPPSLSTPASSSISTPSSHRGGIAIGVPAQHARPPQQPTFFNQPFTGLARGSVNVSDPSTNTTSATTVRPPVHGVQGMGMIGSQLRPGGVSGQPQQRPAQPSIRSQSPSSSQSLASQKIQGHSLLRVSSMGSPGASSPGTSQNSQNPSQPWMSAGQQGKQTHSSLPVPSYRPQMKPQSLQQRSHIPQQQQQPLAMASHQQHMQSTQQQQQPSPSPQSQEHHVQQYPPPRAQSLPHQYQLPRGQGLGHQKTPALTTVQPTNAQSGPQNVAANADAGECGDQILGKRSIRELVSQIDPSERFDPEVEDMLVEIADEFVDSITTFACSMAKHRKSATLEAKDVLLHLERNWNIALPGFGGDEIKCYKKPFAADIHKERLAAIKKSIVGVENVTKGSAGQAAGNPKGHASKAPIIGSPKTSEVP